MRGLWAISPQFSHNNPVSKYWSNVVSSSPAMASVFYPWAIKILNLNLLCSPECIWDRSTVGNNNLGADRAYTWPVANVLGEGK